MNKSIKEKIREEIKKGLPGEEFQNKMAPEIRFKSEKKENPSISAVSILLYLDSNCLKTIFIKRTDYNGTHGGQIGLPGGKFEQTDSNIMETALRETEEEIGVPKNEIEILGCISELYIYASNFNVTPFVGFLKSKPKLIPNPKEVDYILEIDLVDLFTKENKLQKDFHINDITFNCPYYKLENNEILWGATAMIISEFEEIIKRSGISLHP